MRGVLPVKMKEIYLDNASANKVDARVKEVMLKCFDVVYGNPSSIHFKGIEAKE